MRIMMELDILAVYTYMYVLLYTKFHYNIYIKSDRDTHDCACMRFTVMSIMMDVDILAVYTCMYDQTPL